MLTIKSPIVKTILETLLWQEKDQSMSNDRFVLVGVVTNDDKSISLAIPGHGVIPYDIVRKENIIINTPNGDVPITSRFSPVVKDNKVVNLNCYNDWNRRQLLTGYEIVAIKINGGTYPRQPRYINDHFIQCMLVG